MAENIPEIGVMKSQLLSPAINLFKQGNRGRTAVSHLVIRVEPGEMDRGIGPGIIDNPADQCIDLLRAVIEPWDHKINDLDMHSQVHAPVRWTGALLRASRRKPSGKIVGKRFDIHPVGIQHGLEVPQAFFGDVPVRHVYRSEPYLRARSLVSRAYSCQMVGSL